MPELLLAPLPAYVHRKADRHQPWKDRHVLYLGLLVLAVVVDLFVPEESLVTISPEEVLGPKILVRIFDTLFQRWEVFPMLPMLVPQVPRVDASEDEAGDDDID